MILGFFYLGVVIYGECVWIVDQENGFISWRMGLKCKRLIKVVVVWEFRY